MEKMSTAEVLEFLGISRPTLQSRIDAGEITPLPGNPILKRQRRLEFDRVAIEAYKAAAEKMAASRQN